MERAPEQACRPVLFVLLPELQASGEVGLRSSPPVGETGEEMARGEGAAVGKWGSRKAVIPQRAGILPLSRE